MSGYDFQQNRFFYKRFISTEKKRTPASIATQHIKPVKLWTMPQVKDPLEGLTWYQRLWIELFKPEILRSN